MKIYIVRHADKEVGDFFNPVLNHQDQPISKKGIRESKELVSYFSGKEISDIYISSYIRTGQTIEYVARGKNMTPVIDERLNEIDNGCIDGMKDSEIKEKFPEVWKAYSERTEDFQFPEGETGMQAQARIRNFLEEKQKRDEDGDIIVVCHDGLIRLTVCYIINIPVYKRWQFKVDTCGIMEIEYQKDYQEWKLIRFNQKYE